MSIVHSRMMVCDAGTEPNTCGWREEEPFWDWHPSLPFAVESNAWHHDGDASLPLHAAEELELRKDASTCSWPTAVEIADWCHPSIVSYKTGRSW